MATAKTEAQLYKHNGCVTFVHASCFPKISSEDARTVGQSQRLDGGPMDG